MVNKNLISNDVRNFLSKHEDLINEGDFRVLFQRATEFLPYRDARMIYNIIFQTLNIPNLINILPSMLRVYIEIIGVDATFIGWKYDYETADEKKWYKEQEGKHGNFVGLDIAADNDNDKDNFLQSYWDFICEDGTKINSISGSAFKLDKNIF